MWSFSFRPECSLLNWNLPNGDTMLLLPLAATIVDIRCVSVTCLGFDASIVWLAGSKTWCFVYIWLEWDWILFMVCFLMLYTQCHAWLFELHGKFWLVCHDCAACTSLEVVLVSVGLWLFRQCLLRTWNFDMRAMVEPSIVFVGHVQLYSVFSLKCWYCSLCCAFWIIIKVELKCCFCLLLPGFAWSCSRWL